MSLRGLPRRHRPAPAQRLPGGWSDKELRTLLPVPVHPFLLAAVRQGRARRERLDGVYVYLCSDPRAGQEQLRARQARPSRTASSWCCWCWSAIPDLCQRRLRGPCP